MASDSLATRVPAPEDAVRAYAGKMVAVTGANGFIGGAIVRRLASADCQVLRVSRSELGDPAAWHHAVEANVVFHLAAQTSITIAAQDPPEDFAANVAPLRALLAACRERGRRPIVIFAGTVTQCGVAERLPVNEDAADEPVTVYDRHKLIAEQDLKHAAADGAICGASLRLANVYGPGEGYRADRHVLNRMISSALRGDPLTVYGAGDAVRDYVFVDDVVDAFLMAATGIERINGRHFVIGSGRGTAIRDAFDLVSARVAAVTGRRVPVVSVQPPQGLSTIEQRDFVADASRFAAATGWCAKWNLAGGIDRTIEAYRCES